MTDEFNAFIDQDLRVKGADQGPLVGTSFSVKDLYDIAGYVTGCGNPTWAKTHAPATQTAPVIKQLLAAGACVKGKTHTDELAFSLNGENFHYGTPINPNAEGRIPGGSSNGSAVAVAGEVTDFALGTDTGGSVRLPASYCGIYGLRPTHNRIPLVGLMPLAPSFDTIGWFARDPKLLRKVGQVVFSNWQKNTVPTKLLYPKDLWALADGKVSDALRPALMAMEALFGEAEELNLSETKPEDWFMPFRISQGWEIWKNHGDWVTKHNPVFGPDIAERFKWTSTITDDQYAGAEDLRDIIRARLKNVLKGGAVIVMPTVPSIAPLRGQTSKQLESYRFRALQLTATSVLTGVPQINLPLGQIDGCPIGLSLMAAHGSDEMLLSLAEKIGGVANKGIAPLIG